MIRVLLLLVMLLGGCHKRDSMVDELKKIRINIGKDPQSLDPRKARDLTSITLMRTGKTGDIEPALAESVDISTDGLQYCFHLRKSFWSNGQPVTSSDFAETWKAMLDPHFPTDIAYQLYVIKNARKARLGEINLEQVGIKTPDEHTLVVELEQPIPYFLQLLTLTSFLPVPVDVVNGNPDWALETATYICNGPFSPTSWKHSDELKAQKNNRYWQAKDVRLDQIDLYITAVDTEMQMFEEGKLDWAGSPLSRLPVDAVSSLKESEKLHVNPFSGTYFFRVNTGEKIGDKKNPMSSSSFRKALAFALNRKSITEHLLQGGQTPAISLVPKEMGLSDKGYFHDDNQDRARSLLLDALLELDLTLATLDPIKISYSSNERNAVIVQAIQRQWEEGLKIKVELEAVEPKSYFKRISHKEYQLAAGDWTADFNDPINFLEVFKYKDAGSNNTNWENGKYIDLLNRSDLTLDVQERKGLLREAEQILMDQMPIIPVFHFALNYLQADGLEDVALSPLGQIDFRWAERVSTK